ncbi:MAG TPA: ElyC/SanA/YdcF family protein [Anaerolineaceae bacterium]|nr:ElyC/SanA/YdcF family protein [Anaerolineaceae bacterium]
MLKKLLFFLGLIVLFILAVNLYIYLKSFSYVLPITSMETFPVGIVPGAGLNRDKTPSLALRDRLDGAIQFYQTSQINKILMSGDNRTEYYDEPTSMRNYALQKGVPDFDIVLDFAGQRTYDTCYRAKHIFGLERVAIFTQTYHLWRAVYLCRSLGLDAYGVAIEESTYIASRYRFWLFREVFARISAVWDVTVGKPIPILGEPEPIFP